MGLGKIEIMHVKYLTQCSAHSKCPINSDHYVYFHFYWSKVDSVWMVMNHIDILFCRG